MNDLNAGVLPNGLFWTAEIPKHAFRVSRNGRSALLNLSRQPLVDTFEFGGQLAIPAQVDVHVVWHAIEAPMERGEGTMVDPTDPAAFLGLFAEARAMSKASGVETGFSFKTGRLTADAFFAEMGEERNGVFLST